MPVHLVKNFLNCVLIGLTVAVANTALAHHSLFAFYMDTFMDLEGVVMGLELRNPHISVTMLIENESGEEEVWELAGDSANAVERRGITRDTLRVGDRIRVAGYPSKLGHKSLLITNILMPDGKEHLLTERPRPWRWSQPPAETQATAAETSLGRSIFRVWSFGEFMQLRSPLMFTSAAQAAIAAWDPLTDMLALQCIPPGMPNAMYSPYPIEFIDEGDQIRLRIEEWGAIRLIDMVVSEIPADAPGTPHGYSIGRWEDDSLIVETGRIYFPYMDDAGTPMSEQVRMRERFSLSEDGNRLDYENVITDPQTLTEPAIWNAAWVWVPSKQIMSFECDPQ